MQDQPYLTTEETAAYLRIKERKLYELVAQGGIPCSKVTGKWLFPRAALDAWVANGLFLPEGFHPGTPPAIIGGSNDPLLEWAARQSGSGLAVLSEGSVAGLDRLERNEVAMAAIHLHGDGDDEQENAAALMTRAGLSDTALIAFVRREQGLMLPPGNPLGLTGFEDALNRKARFGLRQKGAGALLLLQQLLTRNGVSVDQLPTAEAPYPTGSDLAVAIRAGDVDCGVATRAVAAGLGLDFLPLAWERFDLAMRQRTYFLAGSQALFTLMRSPAFRKQATTLGGYETDDTASVRFVR